MTPPRRPSEARAWVRVDLDALAANAKWLQARAAPAEVLAVVKADAYGHGAAVVAPALERAGIGWFAVANAEEGGDLREAGVAGRILVLGPAAKSEYATLLAHELTPVVSSFEELDSLEHAALGGDAALHIKVDTGMGRLGFDLAELPAALERIRGSRSLRMTGFASHLAWADEPASPFNQRQAEAFDRALARLSEEELEEVRVHLGNSGATLHLEGLGLGSARRRLVRCGLALYGLDPARRVNSLRPAMSVHARVARIRDLAPGWPVGYGGTWVARRPSRVAVIPVGYADGYPLALSSRADALLGGRRVPVAGRVSMDMTVLDVTDVAAALGDEVVLLGRQGEEAISAWELADRAGSIPWEILCGFKLRLPRIYAGS